MLKLIIGDKNYSSWSLRPWLLLKMIGEPFDEHMIRLKQPDTVQRIRQLSPSGKVPLLLDGRTAIWDSLAIAEYLNECYPAAHLWPDERGARALARSMCAEMHAGFTELRRLMPMDICGRYPREQGNDQLDAEIARVMDILERQRQEFSIYGPWLFGSFTIADAFFAPVATRFISYGVELPEAAQIWSDHLLACEPMQEWVRAAEAEMAS